MQLTPCHRSSDPRSSFLADKEITESGKRENDIQRAEKAVEMYPNCTSRELAEITGLCRYMLAKRLPESRKVYQSGERKCIYSNRLCVTWDVF